MEAFARTKDLPQEGFFGHVRDYLYNEKLWEIKISFQKNVSRLGCSYDDRCRTDVIAFDNSGPKGSWKGRYGGSTAIMFENNMAAQATAGQISTDIPSNVAILEVTRHSNSSWVRMYLNPVHQNKMISEVPKNVDMDRAKKILKVFKGLKAPYRHDDLHKIKATTKELQDLVDNKWLKCHKGKKPFKHEKPSYIGKYPITYKYYEFGGARITTEGKNIIIKE